MLSDERAIGRARTLELDFWLPAFGIAIEFDERQHFTRERRISLGLYKGTFPFDTERWLKLCSDGVADPDPPCRDWQRAFRDSVRDIRSRAAGLPLLRVYHRDLKANNHGAWEVPNLIQVLEIAQARVAHVKGGEAVPSPPGAPHSDAGKLQAALSVGN
jgi:hypothetical protein